MFKPSMLPEGGTHLQSKFFFFSIKNSKKKKKKKKKIKN